MPKLPPVTLQPDRPRTGSRNPRPGSRRTRPATAFLAGMLALALVCSCSKPPEPPPTPPPTPVPTPTPTPTPKPTPTPPPPPPPSPTPTPVVHHYLPNGMYYVTEDITVRLTGGLLGVPAGTRVTELKDMGENLQVTDGHDQFLVKKAQLINDMEQAAPLLKRVQAAQTAADQYQAEQNALLLKEQQAQLEFQRTHPLATPTPTPVH